MFTIGNKISFVYNGRLRFVRIEKVKIESNMLFTDKPTLITGYDYSVEGYRSFKVWEMTEVQSA